MTEQNYVDNIIEAFREHGTYAVLNDYQKYFPPYPARFSKPVLKSGPSATATEVIEYGHKLAEYEANVKIFNAEKEEYNKVKNRVEDIMIEEMKKETDFYTVVPEKSQSKVWSRAWEEGHSNGYYSVYQSLESLVELF